MGGDLHFKEGVVEREKVSLDGVGGEGEEGGEEGRGKG